MHRGVIAVLALSLLCACPALASGGDIGSNDLIEGAQDYDRREVAYSGEVIGDILDRGDHVWLNVSDGANAVGVWAERNLASEIQVAGRYDRHGDTVRVTGVFHQACPEHGGDFDIHAEAVALTGRGYPLAHEVHPWKVWLAVLTTFAAAACMILVLLRPDRSFPGRRAGRA